MTLACLDQCPTNSRRSFALRADIGEETWTVIYSRANQKQKLRRLKGHNRTCPWLWPSPCITSLPPAGWTALRMRCKYVCNCVVSPCLNNTITPTFWHSTPNGMHSLHILLSSNYIQISYIQNSAPRKFGIRRAFYILNVINAI